MAKVVTMRLDEPVYREFRALASEEHRPLGNWIVAILLKHIQECQFVDELEMASIHNNPKLVRELRQGSRDAKLKRGRLVG